MKDRPSFIVERRDRLIAALTRTDGGSLDGVLDILERAWLEDRFVLLAGNGGSAATAEHMNLDLSKTIARIAGPGRGFRTIALTHGSALSAWANDLARRQSSPARCETSAVRGTSWSCFLQWATRTT